MIEKKAESMKSGSFTGLAENYSKYRPKYSDEVLNGILGVTGKQIDKIDFVDVGAGTGIWTRMVNNKGVASTIAIEPNDDMRNYGKVDSQSSNIIWKDGSGENTRLPSDSADLLSMASSFHWVNFERATKEFTRVLKPGGDFVALWNPRYIESNPLLAEIEKKLHEFVKNLKRVSSGRSGLTEVLTEKLSLSPLFSNVTYIEGYHLSRQTPEEYLGVWWSVNDIRAQAGEQAFSDFMFFVEKKIRGLEYIDTTYQTRAWVAKSLL